MANASTHTDLSFYITELTGIVGAWETVSLNAALNRLRVLGLTDSPAHYVMAQTLQHRLHGRPAPSLAGFKATGAGGFGA